MLVYTQNSLYHVAANGDHFKITKVDSRNPHKNGSMGIGQTVTSNTMYVKIGEPAIFGGALCTSFVIKVG